MDLLRFLMMLPVRLARRIYEFVAKGWPMVFGRTSWTAPAWMQSLIDAIRQRPERSLMGALGVFLVVVLGWAAIEWYLHRPMPEGPPRISFEFLAPAVTDYEHPDGTPGITVHMLEVDFSGSAAPIELVGKKVAHGITMSPAIKGTWTWDDDHTLRFKPAADWPVGAHIEVQFDVAQVIAPHVLLADDHGAFDTQSFSVTTGTGEFYQDPQNPTAKKTIMPLVFNYPVDPTELEKRISLDMLGRGGSAPTPLKFTVAYDAAKLKAWIHSQPLDLPRDEDVVRLTLASGVRSSRGGDGTLNEQKVDVVVPGLYSLTVGDVSPTLVNNDKFEPEQVIVASTSDTVRSSDLANVVHAWVLPRRKPGHKQHNDEPPYEWDVGEVSDTVLHQSQPLKLDAVPTEQEFSDLQSFKYQAIPGQRVFIRFAAGLKSFGGYILGHPKSQAFTVPDYPKLLRFMADGALLSLSGDKHVSIVSRNEPGVKLEIGRVLPDQLQHLVSFNQGTFAQPELSGLGEDHIVERFQETRGFPKGNPGEAHYEGIDLGDYLKAGKHGIFLLRLSPFDPDKAKKKADNADNSDAGDDNSDDNSGDQSEQTDNRLIVVTDLGILAKKALDGSRDVFVESIHTGQPVGDARVSVIALNGEPLYSSQTSADGEVHFPTLKGLAHDKRPVMYLVTKGDDLSFLPIRGEDRKLDFSRFDIGGESNPTSESELSAYLFSDRGIYRPGDLFHIGVIVRMANWAKSPAGIPLQAEIVDPRGVMVRREAVSVDASGFTELSYTPAETAPTGTWTINLYIVGKDTPETSIGSTTVSVKEFLPDSMKVAATLSQHVADGWVSPENLKGEVDVQNLFGTPAADRRVEASVTLNPAFPEFGNWPDYQFYDLRHAKDGYTTQLQDGQTNDAGHAEFDLDLKKYADATYRLDFLAKAYEPTGGRNVAASAQALVSRNAWLVGYKATDDLSYIKRGGKRAIHLVAIDPQTHSIPLKGLQVQLIERRYVSVLTKQDSGVYKYESKLKEVPVSTNALEIPAGGIDYALATDKPGDYALLIRSGGLTVNRIEYSVTGEANLSRSLDRNAELEIKLNKQDYVPGEAVEVSLRAPYEGSGLITIERDKVYAHAWFHATTTNSVQHIVVPQGFEGNGYINVQYIRDPSSNEVFMSPLTYGVVPFSVNVDARRNPLTVDAPQLAKPGDTVTFKAHSAKPAKVVVFAVDEGILQVARYKLGDPLKYFFRKRMLEVQTSQILDLILPDFKKLMALSAPGGDGGDAIGRQLNPFKRHRDKPVAYWSGIVDVNGEKDLQYTVPDYFHGKLRVMAVSVSPELIGTYEGSTTVRGDFVLSPDAPTTLAPGDEADVGVGVANNITDSSNKAIPIAVTLKTGPQLQVIGPATQTVSLASMREGAVTFRVRATDQLGSGGLTFVASANGKSAQQRVDVSVRPASPFRTQLDVGRLEPGGKTLVSNLRHLYDAYAGRTAAISTVPTVLSGGLADWLANYDNYCSEQIVSKSMPGLVLAKWLQVPLFGRALQTQAGANAALSASLEKQIDVLRSRQNEQGGFGLWTATPDSEPFVSAYVMNFLLEARDRGAQVPKEMIDSGNAYLHQLAAEESASTLEELRQRAYAVYLLTRQGIVTTNDLGAVQKRLQEAYPTEWKNDLAAAWLAASYKLMKQDKGAENLIQGPELELQRTATNDAYFYDYYYDPLTRDATVLYLLAKHFPDQARALSPHVMENIARPLELNEFNTLSASMTILALDAYGSTNATSIEKLGIDEVDGKANPRSIAKLENNLLQEGVWSGAATGIRFSDASNIPAWYIVGAAGYDRGAPANAIKNGIEIIHEYADKSGMPVQNVTLGEEVTVASRFAPPETRASAMS